MPELLAHLVGDYCLQNHWMANNKTKAWLPAVIHVLFYMLPFLLLTQSLSALAVMSGTHLLIDRYRLARYWVNWWGVGCCGRLWCPRSGVCSAHQPAPDWLAVWLLIIVDNTAHLTINHACLKWL